MAFSCKGAGRRANHAHFSVPHLEDLIQIVDVRQDEIEVANLAASPQEFDAAAAQTRARRRVTPARDHLVCECGAGHIPCSDELSGNPRAANLILFAKLALGTRANQSDSIVILCEMTGKR